MVDEQTLAKEILNRKLIDVDDKDKKNWKAIVNKCRADEKCKKEIDSIFEDMGKSEDLRYKKHATVANILSKWAGVIVLFILFATIATLLILVLITGVNFFQMIQDKDFLGDLIGSMGE